MKKLAALALILLGIGVICAFFVFDKNDFVKLKGDPYLQEKSIDATAIKSIYTETDTFDLTYVQGTSNEVKLRLEGNVSKKLMDKIIFTAETKGDSLYIKSNTKNQFFSFGISIVNLHMTIELPEKLWDNFQAETDTGKININKLNAANLELETDTGNIAIGQLEAKKLSLKSDTGDLKVSNYTVSDIQFETNTGNVKLEDGTGTLQGETDTGNVRVEAAELKNDIAISTDTGNITINVDKQPTSATILINKEIGKTQIEWEGLSESSDSKSNVKRVIGGGDLQIELESDTGNIKLGKR
ncbi:DUF4097 family beta strand repeat-containing protein [Paenibacillus luteus]|uniref:DUF4097 family beta strand repeat-containing protein n=1 Tax=Paenibacillus luteus TaxID=2545753 RepID=UPI0011412621|nr:DUF4097 family beta strand repeat-containing protein [Paenibacillus luteus]